MVGYLLERNLCLPLQRNREKSIVDGTVVQLVRIHACHAWGHGFESRPHRKKEMDVCLSLFLWRIDASVVNLYLSFVVNG